MNLFSNIKGDIYGGISAGVVALPVALAFGTAAGLDPINGLYGAIFLGIIAAALGGTSTLISNPTGPMAVVTAIIVSDQIAAHGGSFSVAFPSIILIFFLAGAIQVLFGLLKLGRYVAYIPYPVISGFMSGIGMIIIILQLSHFFGIHIKYNVMETIENVDHLVTNANWTNALLAGATILIVYMVPKSTKILPAKLKWLATAVPSTLVALIAVTAFSHFFIDTDLKRIGQIPNDIPKLRTDVFSQFSIASIGSLFLHALSLAGLGMVDSLLTSVVADKLTSTRHNSNRELVGQGIGNMVSALFGGMPGAGTTPATVLNINSGGRTRLSGIIHGLVLVIILLFLSPVAAVIPYAVLSGILITVGISVLDQNVIKDIKYVPRIDNIIMFVVLAITVFYGLLTAVAVGLIMAALHFMKRMADIVEQETSHKRVETMIQNMIGTFENADEFREKVSIMTLNGPLFFGFASRFQEKIDNIPDTVKAVAFDFSHVLHMDQSGAYTFRDTTLTLKERGINVIICDIQKDKLEMFKGIRVVPGLIDAAHIFDSVEEGVIWLNQPGHLENDFDHDSELYIPSAFSPNDDGINDDWEIRHIDKYPKCNVMVYTKSNIMVYEAIGGYNTPWEGKNLRGRAVPIGKYIYEIDLHGDGKDVRMGTVSVFR